MAMKVKNLLIIGSGLMGSGIAQATAQSKASFESIVIQDVNQAALEKAQSRIKSNLVKMKEKKGDINVEEILDRITFSTSMEPKSSQNLLVIEAVPEILQLKQKLFKDLGNKFGQNDSVILATNTSSLCCKDIASELTSLDRFAGLHFFNPVPLMKLVEVVRVKDTSDDTFNALLDYCKSINKVPVSCRDTPGFIVNRLLLPYMMDAMKMLERGDASARDIDTAMKLGAGYPMGPFELADYVGLDTVKLIIDGWIERDSSFIGSSEMLNKMVEKGHIGKKAGKGFYEY